MCTAFRGNKKQALIKLPLAIQGPGEIKRREVVLDPQVSPEEIRIRKRSFKKNLFGHKLLLNSGATDTVLVTLAKTVETAIA